MRCPVCGDSRLVAATTDGGPRARECPRCSGRWVDAAQYWRWREREGSPAPAGGEAAWASAEVEPVANSGPGKLCPGCGRFLIRRRVGKGVGFHVDRCGGCGGLWLDGREWEALVAAGLHREAHLIATEAWQRQLQADEAAAQHEQRVAAILGDADFAEAQRLRAWLRAHPQRPTLLAYLQG